MPRLTGLVRNDKEAASTKIADSDHISNFEMNSLVVSTFDAEIADYIKAEIVEDRFSNFHITRTNCVFLKLRGGTVEYISSCRMREIEACKDFKACRRIV